MTHGFVQNLARPGGNATGFTFMEPTTTGKWLECSRRLRRAATGPPYCSIRQRRRMPVFTSTPFKAAAASLGLESIAATVHDRAELETVIAAQAREPNGGLIVIPDGFLNVHRGDIIALAARYRLPTIYPWRFF
ncbi:MAG: ABC transporter substrate-binding protein, partial [Pseudolabrys sp.]